jgi:hypothetical protein
LVAAALAAGLAPLAWDVILRHTGGDFFVDAPGLSSRSVSKTRDRACSTALSTLFLGFGPLRAASAQRVALAATICGLAALLVDIYLY